eukprot:CAMPEP_0182448714 /NCGR_PEP_ID=MMETSP1172-20130603/29058_1 /TAXON_ID=708627 /ORGANISM="Timspurckia oligopyrenoides, Strain CCMP3278" /LENGTH=279 /DNA_ID=CAMNT_0024645675 /DNA_START=69 /DNA_END=908 /DNA_ORIENTATION=-
MKLLLSVIGVLVLAQVCVAQTCECDFFTNTFCPVTILSSVDPEGTTRCVEEIIATCDRYECVAGGPETCVVEPSTVLRFNGTEDICITEPTEQVHPVTTPTASPTPAGTVTQTITCQIDALVPWQPPLVCFIEGTSFQPGSTITGGEFIVLQAANGTATLFNANEEPTNGTFFAFITNRFNFEDRFEPWPQISTTVNRVTIPANSDITTTLSLPFFETRLAALDPFVTFVQGLVDTRTTGNVTYNTNAVLQLGTGLTGGILESAFSTAFVEIDIFFLPP